MLTYSRDAVKGKLLISEPALLDYYFERSVVLLIDHTEEGSFGVIINKPVNIKLNDIINDIPENDLRVFLGGPVSPDNLFFVHKLGNVIEDSLEISDGIYWGGNFDQIKEMISDNQINSDTLNFYLGYAGWSPAQLNKELEDQSWVVVNSSPSLIFNKNPHDMWSGLLRKMGDKYAIWANQPMDPFLN